MAVVYTPPAGTEFDTRHKIGFPVAAIDIEGNVRAIDGAWSVVVQVGEGSAAEDPAVPGRIEYVTGSNAGRSEVIVSGDAHLGADVVTISETFIFDVGAAPVPMAASVSSSGFEAPSLK